jgi:hypothetical protein
MECAGGVAPPKNENNTLSRGIFKIGAESSELASQNLKHRRIVIFSPLTPGHTSRHDSQCCLITLNHTPAVVNHPGTHRKPKHTGE